MNVSKQTVTDTFKELQSNEVLIKIKNVVYMLSPDIIALYDAFVNYIISMKVLKN